MISVPFALLKICTYGILTTFRFNINKWSSPFRLKAYSPLFNVGRSRDKFVSSHPISPPTPSLPLPPPRFLFLLEKF